MPTVHLSLPEKVYSELKLKAAEMGIQVTDLIKIFIQMGLRKELLVPGSKYSNKEIDFIAKKLDEIDKRTKMTLMRMEGKIRQLEEMFLYLHERMDNMDDILAQLTRSRIYSEALIEKE